MSLQHICFSCGAVILPSIAEEIQRRRRVKLAQFETLRLTKPDEYLDNYKQPINPILSLRSDFDELGVERMCCRKIYFNSSNINNQLIGLTGYGPSIKQEYLLNNDKSQ